MKVAKELLKKRRKEAKIPFIFWLYFWVQQPFCGRGNHSRIQRKWLHLPNKVLKCVSHLQQFVLQSRYKSKFNMVMSRCVFVLLASAYQLASSRHNPACEAPGIWQNRHARAEYFASSKVEESPFSLKGPEEVRTNLSLPQGRFLFSCMCFFTSC